MNNFSLDVVLTGIPEPGAERDLAIAETWMGWTLSDRGFYVKGMNQPESYNTPDNWKPSKDIAAAFQMEDAIIGQWHMSAYIRALAVVLLEDGLSCNEEDQWWLFAHATPEQRSKAALVAWAKVQAHKEGENGTV